MKAPNKKRKPKHTKVILIQEFPWIDAIKIQRLIGIKKRWFKVENKFSSRYYCGKMGKVTTFGKSFRKLREARKKAKKRLLKEKCEKIDFGGFDYE